MNDDPIREEQSIFMKIKEWFKKHTRKTVESPTKFISIDQYTKSVRDCQKAIAKCGVTTQEFSDGLLHFSRVLTPNEMRKIMEERNK